MDFHIFQCSFFLFYPFNLHRLQYCPFNLNFWISLRLKTTLVSTGRLLSINFLISSASFDFESLRWISSCFLLYFLHEVFSSTFGAVLSWVRILWWFLYCFCCFFSRNESKFRLKFYSSDWRGLFRIFQRCPLNVIPLF